ncbi:MAG: hypothetical protein K8R59_13535 [Thermoanaerobaculales bacterium]|nr:hypothetical protein [Thermoanaerobaculales bacterium]
MTYRGIVIFLVTITVVALVAPTALAGFGGADVYLPSVGRGPGAESSDWYTTIWVNNPSGSAVNVSFLMYERNGVGTPVGSFSDTIQPGDTVRYPNAVENMFGLGSTFGAIRVVADGNVIVNSRIFSVPAGGDESDSVGQFFSGVPAQFAIGLGETTDLLGVYQTDPQNASDYRYNFGFMETSGAQVTVRASAVNDLGVTIATKDYVVGSFQPKQVNITDLAPGINQQNLRIGFEVIAGAGHVVVFGSGLANVSNDPSTFEMAYSEDLLGSGASSGIDTVNAGQGLSGGGSSSTVTLNVGAGDGISVLADTVGIAVGGVTNSRLADGGVSQGKLDAMGAVAGHFLSTSGSNLVWAVAPEFTLPYEGTVATTGKAFKVENSSDLGTGWAGYFKNTDEANTYPALIGSTEGSGVAVYGNNLGTGPGVKGVSSSSYGVEAYSIDSNALYAYGNTTSDITPNAHNELQAAIWADGGDASAMYATSSAPYSGAISLENNVDHGRGLFALATGDNAHALYAVAGFGTSGTIAAWLQGDVDISGSLSKGGGSFKIDHPLDPETKYLSHSFVESPDMMNVYNGNVVLDAEGRAVIELPDWFEVLNRDFRYQLTPIGAPGPNLFVASEVAGNRFEIAGGTPGMTVSWQVTGIRHDSWAEANRIQVEKDKSLTDQGKYLHPEALGADPMQRIGYTGKASAE